MSESDSDFLRELPRRRAVSPSDTARLHGIAAELEVLKLVAAAARRGHSEDCGVWTGECAVCDALDALEGDHE